MNLWFYLKSAHEYWVSFKPSQDGLRRISWVLCLNSNIYASIEVLDSVHADFCSWIDVCPEFNLKGMLHSILTWWRNNLCQKQFLVCFCLTIINTFIAFWFMEIRMKIKEPMNIKNSQDTELCNVKYIIYVLNLNIPEVRCSSVRLKSRYRLIVYFSLTQVCCCYK